MDAYFKIVVRNLRDLIPKQASYFIMIKGTKEIQFEAYNFIAHSDKLEKWFLEVNYLVFSHLMLESKEKEIKKL
mgnify:CR=1 FL=1